MITFYDHPQTGRLWYRGDAGGGDPTKQTGKFDGPASQIQIDTYPKEYIAYLEAKAKGQALADKQNLSDFERKNLYIKQLEIAQAQYVRTIEALQRRIAELEGR